MHHHHQLWKKWLLTFLLAPVFSFTFAQNANNMPDKMYSKQWSEIQSLENEGKTKTALEKIDLLVKQAQSDNNPTQIIKALFHRYKYMMVIEENSESKIVQELQDRIAGVNGIEKALLQSILAECLNNYYENNSWQFQDRTNVEGNAAPTDFKTWDQKRFNEETRALYLASVQDAILLQSTDITAIGDILTEKGKDSKLRPTLYDFLVHRAIDHFSSTNENDEKGTDEFLMESTTYFSSANEFANFSIPPPRNNYKNYDAIKLYQELTKFSLKRNNIPVLIQLELERLSFVNASSVHSDKKDLYKKALERLINDYTSYPAVSNVYYNLISHIQTNASKTEEGYSLKRAVQLCDEINKKYPEEQGSKNCLALKQTILNPSIQILNENFLSANKASKVFIDYKNIDKVFVKIIPIKATEDIYKNRNGDEVLKLLNSKKVLKSWSVVLPNPGDYWNHTTEIMLDGLAPGKYVIMVATSDKFTKKEQCVAYKMVQATNIALITQNGQNVINYYALNRITGSPLGGAKIDVYQNNYDYNSRIYKKNKVASLTADANGWASYAPANVGYNNYYATVTYQKEVFDPVYAQYFYGNTPHPETNHTVIQLFTDRSIYRPGQKVYFKGIVFINQSLKNEVVPDYKTIIHLNDVNNQEVGKLEVTSNEFGSFTGSFDLPVSGLTGTFSLVIETLAYHNIQVEEYKRPKFEVEIPPLDKSFTINDKVVVVGKATAYSGANIDGADVNYRVVRKTIYPRWCYSWYYWFMPNMNDAERIITTGTTKTDANGNFTIPFEAIPDLSADKKLSPFFHYEIQADVVDITGETHSGSTIVKVGYVGLEADIQIAENLQKDQKNELKVTTNNLNGQFEAAQVEVTIYKLNDYTILKKARLWEMPDQFVISKEQHDKYFPNDVYNDETNPSTWEIGALIKKEVFNTKDKKSIELLPNTLIQSGAYLVELSTKDKNGQAVTVKKIIYATAFEDNKLSPPNALSVVYDKTSYQPNETAKIRVGTSIKGAFVHLEATFKGTPLLNTTFILHDEIKIFDLPIKEEYRGGIEVQAFLVYDNRSYQYNGDISVPYDSKELKVEWSSFRDKLLPGQNETWSLKIKGPKSDAVNAEMLATMYDASLDAFLPHNYALNIYQPYYYGYLQTINAGNNFNSGHFTQYDEQWQKWKSTLFPNFENINYYGFSLGYGNRMYLYDKIYFAAPVATAPMESEEAPEPKKSKRKDDDVLMDANVVFDTATAAVERPTGNSLTLASPQLTPAVKVRTNLNETALFLPQLRTDEQGNISFNFTMPEALTRWKFIGLAHTKTMDNAVFTKEVVTQKELMVTPNAPRFLREGDKIIFSAKVTNLSEGDLNGQVELRLKDASTGQLVNIDLGNTNPTQNITIPKGQSTSAKWALTIPFTVRAVSYEVVAVAGNYSDGEGATLPVLTNRMLVTESMPLPIRGKQTKTFNFTKLIESRSSSTIKHEKLTLEYTSQPAWYAVQAIPYLMEFPYECAEQLFSRYYANALGTNIVNSSPRIKEVFDQWKGTKEALLSNLEKNQELKSLMLEETPWLLQAKDETESKKRVALFFDLNRMSKEKEAALDKLLTMQTPNGGFTWFPGMPDNRYITQHIISGLGHLQHLKVESYQDERKESLAVKKAVKYLDDRMREDYENIKKYNTDISKDFLWQDDIQYLYMRSFFPYIEIDKKNLEAYDYFMGQTKKYWLNKSMYMKGMIALVLERSKDHTLAAKIMNSLKENAVRNEEMGMYWKELETGGYYWYQAPIETHALMIEAFDEVVKDEEMVDELKTWLLKKKQTQNWNTTKGTTEACYALLMTGDNWLAQTQLVEVWMGGQKIDPKASNVSVEPGTGYYKIQYDGSEVMPDMGKIKVSKKDKGPAWGAIYWQYFEDLDKITPHATPLSIVKKMYKVEKTDDGTKLVLIDAQHPIKPGDEVKVRIELRVDRDMEYVHMKDMRSSGLEPIDVISTYKYQDGLGYYQSTKDAATHFFFDYVSKGTYVFEYSLRANLAGEFSNGITHVECMYAPEFTSHSEGTRLIINEK
ncbi:MAG: alpha-2-macroglobulin [Chitinophagales bacterium]|nr:alpha-2-macroglobulin [Chitinophagales bacterium]